MLEHFIKELLLAGVSPEIVSHALKAMAKHGLKDFDQWKPLLGDPSLRPGHRVPTPPPSEKSLESKKKSSR